MQNEKETNKKKKTSKMFTKKLKQMSSACSISQSLLSSVVNMFQMTFSWKKKNGNLTILGSHSFESVIW